MNKELVIELIETVDRCDARLDRNQLGHETMGPEERAAVETSRNCAAAQLNVMALSSPEVAELIATHETKF